MRFREFIESSITDPWGQAVKFQAYHPRKGETIIIIDPNKLIPYWNKISYIEPGHPHEIGGRIEGFGRWYHGRGNQPVHAPEINFTSTPRIRKEWNKERAERGEIDDKQHKLAWSVDFSDGRHRFWWMVNQGFNKIPVVVPTKDAEDMKQMFSP